MDKGESLKESGKWKIAPTLRINAGSQALVKLDNSSPLRRGTLFMVHNSTFATHQISTVLC